MKRFATGLVLRITGVALTGGGLVYALLTLPAGRWVWMSVGVVGLVWQTAGLYGYVTGVNRKLTRFLESVQYADFAVAFKADSTLGPSFRDLNEQFNAVLDAFRQARAEKETNLQYLNTIVQHVSVGLLSFDTGGNVELVNQAALRLLGIYRLRQLSELQATHPELVTLFQATTPTGPTVYQTDEQVELSVRCTQVRLRGRLVTLVSLQNIHPELQRKELEAWQNLTNVLRHEIMNSVTPIVSLVGTMQQIVDTELVGMAQTTDVSESISDLRMALSTIENRGRGIMRFVDAYRHFTTIPPPKLAEVAVATLLQTVVKLVQPDSQQRDVTIELMPLPAQLRIAADANQIEMVLLNLIRNAIESLIDWPGPVIRIDAYSADNRVGIRITDNGPGIEPEALEKIFIPFFTTKKTGSGIGLSLSRQIMQLHGGQLTVVSSPGQGSTFTLVFG
ncbi:MAG: PAS domain-containing protein [Bacteroidetes bacterium]|nr:PAS domain-containing protein [Fibrella sp.]